jgi:two-component system sensor histidine kinase DesK
MRQDGAVARGTGDRPRDGLPAPEPERTTGPEPERTTGPVAALRGLRDLFAWPATGSALVGETRMPDGRRPGEPGPEEVRKRRITGRRRWYAGSLVGLSFLVIAMVQTATGGGSLGSIVAFEVLAACFGICYMLVPVRVVDGMTGRSAGWSRKLLALGAMLAMTVPMIIIGGPGVTALWIYLGVAAAIMFPLAAAMAIAVGLAGAMLALSAAMGQSLPWELALTLVALTLWMAGFAGNIRLTIELRETREELARAAVVAERARIGRDLHDILGHSLTAIAVKAGLARRLAGRDADAATAEIADVERLAREALADVRATAAGYRDVSLAAELAVALSVLEAAGIRAVVPNAVDDVSRAGKDVFGYVVREAVTNVIRHSRARRCEIVLTPRSVEVIDDGDGPAGMPARDGSGLRGLAGRLAAVGGTLTAGPRPEGGFRVRAEVPAFPLGAAAPGSAAAALEAAATTPADPAVLRVSR